MKYRPVIFAAGSSRHDSEPQSSPERLVNLFPEEGADEDRPVLLRSCPGHTLIASVTGPVRAMLETDTLIYLASGGNLYSFNGTSTTRLGAISDDENTSLAWNGTELACVAGGKYYLWNGTVLKEVAGKAFSDFGSVDFMDGYFLFTEKDGIRHCISGLYDGASLDALDFASAEYRPDNIVLGFVDHSEWWLFGDTTVEVWTNTGAADYPFERVPGAQMERGCLQPNTVAKMDNSVFWVGNDRVIYRAVQYVPQRISNHRVEAAIRAATTLSAFVYEYEGHKFYCLRLDGRPAWVFDVATGSWHERSSGVNLGTWNVTAAARLGASWYVGTEAGKIARVEPVWTEAGAVFRRMAQSRNLSQGGSRFKVPSADVRVRTGAGGTLMMQHSEDNGMTWSREQFRSLGATGEYGKRLQFHRLGSGYEFAMRLSFSDDADFGIYGAGVNVA